jgi:hypothetical protein
MKKKKQGMEFVFDFVRCKVFSVGLGIFVLLYVDFISTSEKDKLLKLISFYVIHCIFCLNTFIKPNNLFLFRFVSI